MPLISQADLEKYRAPFRFLALSASNERSSADTQLRTLALSAKDTDRFDIFLAHKFSDSAELLSIRKYLKDFGLSVYVDWIEDEELDRSKVNGFTASRLRKRMRQCKCLLYAATTNYAESKWMPWECGFFDGMNGKVAILPIVAKPDQHLFLGLEYLSMYPTVSRSSDGKFLTVRNGVKSVAFREWMGAISG